MKFMCLVTLDTEIGDTLTEEDWQEIGQASFAYDKHLMATGVFVHAEALQGAATARTVRIRKGEAMTTDGPFMETKEQVAGFILIDVPDMEAAMDVARGIPMARVGAIELRPVMDFEPR